MKSDRLKLFIFTQNSTSPLPLDYLKDPKNYLKDPKNYLKDPKNGQVYICHFLLTVIYWVPSLGKSIDFVTLGITNLKYKFDWTMWTSLLKAGAFLITLRKILLLQMTYLFDWPKETYATNMYIQMPIYGQIKGHQKILLSFHHSSFGSTSRPHFVNKNIDRLLCKMVHFSRIIVQFLKEASHIILKQNQSLGNILLN